MTPVVQAWVWQVRTGEDGEFWEILSTEEKQRADRFFNAIDRTRWIVARGRVRRLLAETLRVPPGSIAFSQEREGRPVLSGYGTSAPCFSIAHSQDVGMLALSSNIQLGADIEAVRPVTDEEMDWALTEAERDQLGRFDPPAKLEAFFRFWTLKEAFMKATGRGALLPLDDFDINLDGPRLQRFAGPPDELACWRFVEAVPVRDMRAAIAARTGGQDINVLWRHID